MESLQMKICSLTKSENRTKLMKRFSAAMEEVKPFLTLFNTLKTLVDPNFKIYYIGTFVLVHFQSSMIKFLRYIQDVSIIQANIAHIMLINL